MVNIVEYHIVIPLKHHIDDNLEIKSIFLIENKRRKKTTLTTKCTFITTIGTIFNMILKVSNRFKKTLKINLHISLMLQYIVNHYIEIVYLNIFLELEEKAKIFKIRLFRINKKINIRQFCSSVLFPQSLSPSHTHERGIHLSPQSNCDSEHLG